MIMPDEIELKPSYSTKEVPGRCIKCLAEEKLNDCLLGLLRTGGEDSDLAKRYEMIVEFLKSPESLKLRDEAEKYLAEDKKVTVSLSFENGKPKYEIKTHE